MKQTDKCGLKIYYLPYKKIKLYICIQLLTYDHLVELQAVDGAVCRQPVQHSCPTHHCKQSPRHSFSQHCYTNILLVSLQTAAFLQLAGLHPLLRNLN